MALISDESSVVSDYGYLTSEINTIKSKANSILSNMEENALSFGSTTIVPNCEGSIVDKNNENIYVLLNKLDTEIDSILSIGESIRDLDIHLSNEASILNCDIHESIIGNDTTTNASIYGANTELSSETEYILGEYERIAESEGEVSQ